MLKCPNFSSAGKNWLGLDRVTASHLPLVFIAKLIVWWLQLIANNEWEKKCESQSLWDSLMRAVSNLQRWHFFLSCEFFICFFYMLKGYMQSRHNHKCTLYVEGQVIQTARCTVPEIESASYICSHLNRITKLYLCIFRVELIVTLDQEIIIITLVNTSCFCHGECICERLWVGVADGWEQGVYYLGC